MKSNSPLFLLLLLLTGCGLFTPVDDTGSAGRAPRRSGSDPTLRIRQDMVGHAQELIGTKYKFGGNSPREGFDCSGFVRYLYQYAGLEIERTSRAQAQEGKAIRPGQAKPGDLVFYRRPGKPVFHVSLVVDAGPEKLWVVHATSSRGVVRENVWGSSYWRPKIYRVKDLINY